MCNVLITCLSATWCAARPPYLGLCCMFVIGCMTCLSATWCVARSSALLCCAIFAITPSLMCAYPSHNYIITCIIASTLLCYCYSPKLVPDHPPSTKSTGHVCRPAWVNLDRSCSGAQEQRKLLLIACYVAYTHWHIMYCGVCTTVEATLHT